VRELGHPDGSLVADLACGTGDFCRELQKQGLRPIGFDLSFGMLAAARTSAPLAEADALSLPVPDSSLDGITCGFALRNLVELDGFFVELARTVRPGGRIAILEVAEPPNRFLRWGHSIYFGSIVPKVGGLLSDPSAYQYLPKSVAYLPEPGVMLQRLADAGFVQVERQLLSVGISQLITATRSDDER
jgi:demethylmenaquinone methyltransferase/2-methoxy-6-polyprenyl-1,4-benzoquinol methylase